MRPPERRRWAPWALVLCACAGSSSSQGKGTGQVDPTFEHARQVSAAEHAPDLWARALAAEDLAQAERDEAAALDARTEARLWREAAIAEAERIALTQRRRRLEAQAETRARELAELTAQRTQTQAEAERLAAGQLALQEAARVLQLADSEPRRRPRIEPEAARRGARALIDRASLALAAARQLGAAPEALQAVAAHLERARTLEDKQPERALREADEALFGALAALGPVRGERVDDATRQSLVDALRSAGLEALRGDRGLTTRLTPASPDGVLPARGLARLCKVREAFPAGAWQLSLRDPQPARATRRAPALKKQLKTLGCDVEQVDVAGAAGLEQPALEVSFLAY